MRADDGALAVSGSGWVPALGVEVAELMDVVLDVLLAGTLSMLRGAEPDSGVGFAAAFPSSETPAEATGASIAV